MLRDPSGKIDARFINLKASKQLSLEINIKLFTFRIAWPSHFCYHQAAIVCQNSVNRLP